MFISRADTDRNRGSTLVYSREDLLSLSYVLRVPEALQQHLEDLGIFLSLDGLPFRSPEKQRSTFKTDAHSTPFCQHTWLKTDAFPTQDCQHTSLKTDALPTQDYQHTLLKTDLNTTNDYQHTSFKTDAPPTQDYQHTSLKTDAHPTQDYQHTSLKSDAQPSLDYPCTLLKTDAHPTQDYKHTSLKTYVLSTQDYQHTSLKTDAHPTQDYQHTPLNSDAHSSQDYPYTSLKTDAVPSQDYPYTSLKTDAHPSLDYPYASLTTDAHPSQDYPYALLKTEADPSQDYPYTSLKTDAHPSQGYQHTSRASTPAPATPTSMGDLSSSEESFVSCQEDDGGHLSDSYVPSERSEELVEQTRVKPGEETSATPVCSRAAWPTRIECICESLSRILHDGCRAKREMEGSDSDQFQTLFDHFNFVRTSLGSLQCQYRTSSPYECPRHGVLPAEVGQSRCSFCAGSSLSSAAHSAGDGGVADVGFRSAAGVCFGSFANVAFGDRAEVGLGTATGVGFDGFADVAFGDRAYAGLIGGADVGFSNTSDVGFGDTDFDLGGDAEVCFGSAADVGFGDRADVCLDSADVGLSNTDVVLGGDVDDCFGSAADVGFGDRADVGLDGAFVGLGGTHVDPGDDADVRVGGGYEFGYDDAANVGFSSVADGVGSTSGGASTGLSAEEKEKRKVLNKASKKLLKLKRNLETALEETSAQRKVLQAKMEDMDANLEETEKTLRDHVTQLHQLLDHHHQRQRDKLKQRHNDFLHRILVSTMEGQNFEAKLADLQEHVAEKLNRIFKGRDVLAADPGEVKALCDAFNSYMGSKPTLQARSVTYKVEVPQVTADDLQSLMGLFVVTEDIQPPPPVKQHVAPVWPGSGTTPVHPSLGPTTPASGAAPRNRSGPDTQPGGASGKSAPGAPAKARNVSSKESSGKERPKWTAPKWPLDALAPLGSKEKLSDTMASTTSIASSTGSVSTGKKKRSRSRRRKQKLAVKAELLLGTKEKLSDTMASTSSIESSAGSTSTSRTRRSGSATTPVRPASGPTTPASGATSAKHSGPGTQPSGASGKSAQGTPAGARRASLGRECPKWTAPKWPLDASAPLGTKEKLSDTMASTTSIASSTGSVSTGKKKRTRSRKKKEKADVTEQASGPVAIVLSNKPSPPRRIEGRGKQASGFAPRPDSEVWIVYGNRDPHLDLLTEEGDLLESTRIGGNAMGAASFSDQHVLVSFHSPRCQLMLLDARKEARETFKLPMTSTGLGVGSTGIAVSGYTSLYWIPLDGGQNEWIVKENGSTLKNVCSCDVIILQGREIVCVADKDGHAVCFYEKLDSGGFASLPPFSKAVDSKQTEPFTPVGVSGHHSGFLAILDSASRSVIIVDVAKNEAASVLPWEQLCEGVPSVIAFALNACDEDPKLWVSTASGLLYLTSLAFLY